MDASVIIPTHNKPQELRRCLEAVLAQQFDGEFEVLVCDDGSSDSTAAMIEEWRRSEPRLRYLRHPTPRGPAAARNLGIRHAGAPLVAMTDDDTIPDPRWLENLCAAARRPGVAAVEGRVTPGRPVGPCEAAPTNETGGVYLTCNMLYRRDTLAAVGGFDERFPFAAYEDCDLAARVREHGAIAWAPEAIVTHPPRPITWRRILREMRYWPWIMVTARRYGYFGWPASPTRHPRAGAIWNAVVKLPAGRFLSALRALRSHPEEAFRAALRALAEPAAALWLVVPELLRFDLESAAFRMDYLALPAAAPRVGAVIVNTRQPEQLVHCIRSFQAADYPDLRWIPVANWAQQAEVERLQVQLPGLEWVVTGENLGYTGANNLGIQRALDLGCEYILVMNDDIECIAP
ncbi:MAG TPA: glycosyltransferase family 2 protein, partial [Bryobacterales bacterium]|nr:glycosyltransferase family 2 protein [Bryobacterales bacterium]